MMKTGNQHRPLIDLARFVAAFGVVVAHARASVNDWVGHLSLGLFLILTAFLAIQSAERAGGYFRWRQKVPRLLIPWLFWSAFYRALDLAFSDDPGRFALLREPFSLLIGPALHLWFLPFVMLAMLLVQPVARYVTTVPSLILGSALLVITGILMFLAHERLALPVPFPQWAFALPVYIYGLLLAPAHRLGRPAILLAAAVILTGAAWLLSAQIWAFTILAAALAFELFWRLPLRHPVMTSLGKVAFGIYLMHPFFMLVVYKYFGTDMGWVFNSLAAFAASWAATGLMLRLPVLRRLV